MAASRPGKQTWDRTLTRMLLTYAYARGVLMFLRVCLIFVGYLQHGLILQGLPTPGCQAI